jgi:hypothetical protein
MQDLSERQCGKLAFSVPPNDAYSVFADNMALPAFRKSDQAGKCKCVSDGLSATQSWLEHKIVVSRPMCVSLYARAVALEEPVQRFQRKHTLGRFNVRHDTHPGRVSATFVYLPNRDPYNVPNAP